MIKVFLYIFSAIIVIWSMDAVNINSIFKKNEVIKSRVFYMILAFSLIYLLTNFIYDFVYFKNFV